MVYVPILKIDLPEPSVQELLPGLVHLFINSCTRVFDVVLDFLRPLSPEEEVLLYTAAVEHLPKEFRKARKKIAERNIQDEDKMSEELEDAAYAYYRQALPYWAGLVDIIAYRNNPVVCGTLQAENAGAGGRLLG